MSWTVTPPVAIMMRVGYDSRAHSRAGARRGGGGGATANKKDHDSTKMR